MNQSAIIKEKVELAVADGTRMAAYVARPEHGGPHPGLLVFQEAFGVNHHIRNVTERFAAEGYVAIAPELFHRTAPPGFEVAIQIFLPLMPHYQAVTTETAEADIRSAYEWLRSNAQVKASEISSVGFCMGGRISFIANSVVRATRRGLVLRRRNRSRIAGSGCEVASSIIIYMGRIGQAHHPRAPDEP